MRFDDSKWKASKNGIIRKEARDREFDTKANHVPMLSLQKLDLSRRYNRHHQSDITSLEASNCVKEGSLTNAVTDDFDPVEESQNGCQVQHVCNEAEYVHFKFKTDMQTSVN